MLHGLPGVFVPGQMVFLSVMRCGSTMCVRGQIVNLCGSLVRILRH
jgi:hypothetical protein